MADITISDLADATVTEIENAFDTQYSGRSAAGETKADWVVTQLKRHMKNVIAVHKEQEDSAANQAELDALGLD